MITMHRTDRMLSIQEIKVNPHNARTHSQAQIRQIAESIKTLGFGAPVLVDETLTLIAGHGRFKAAEDLNIAEIPAVQHLGLSEAQKRASLPFSSPFCGERVGDSSTVEQRTLTPFILVRIQVPQPHSFLILLRIFSFRGGRKKAIKCCAHAGRTTPLEVSLFGRGNCGQPRVGEYDE
jgi:ParB-like nuclease domain